MKKILIVMLSSILSSCVKESSYSYLVTTGNTASKMDVSFWEPNGGLGIDLNIDSGWTYKWVTKPNRNKIGLCAKSSDPFCLVTVSVIKDGETIATSTGGSIFSEGACVDAQ